MRKISLLVLTITFAWINAFAAVLTPEQALSRANMAVEDPAAITPMRIGTNKLVYTVTAADKLPSVYVFNNPSMGFTILGADDLSEPVLGYSVTGNFDENNIPPSLQYLLDEYSKQLAEAREVEGLNNTTVKQLASRPARTDIAPLINCKWNQGAPFNNQCPVDPSTGARSVTGCVATAMAQVLYYHKHPVTGTGTKSYNWQAPNGTNTRLVFNYSLTTFDWDDMVDNYNGDYSSASADAVAELMYACGVAVEMGYSSSASGAFSENVASGLINYFNIDKGAAFRARDHYGLYEWEDMLYENLRNVGPVYLSGANSGAGHAFVCDGYQGDGFFHINWGWGGVSDGYFKINALDPAAQGIGGSSAGYNLGLDAILGIRPAVEGSKTAPVMSMSSFNVTTTTCALGNDININSAIYSYSSDAIEVMLGLKIESTTDGAITYGTSSYYDNLEPLYGWTTWSATIPTGLANGEYRVYPAFQYEGEWYDTPVSITSPGFVYMTVTNGTARFTAPELDASIYADIIDLPARGFRNKEMELKVNLQNTGNAEFYGEIAAVLLAQGLGGNLSLEAVSSFALANVLPGESEELTVAITPTRLGNYIVAFGWINLETNQIHLFDSGATSHIDIANYTQGSVSASNPRLASEFTVDSPVLNVAADFIVTGGDYSNLVLLGVDGEDGYVYLRDYYNTTLLEGETNTLSFSSPVSSPAEGKRYYYNFYIIDTDNNYVPLFNYMQSAVMQGSSAIEGVEAEREVVSEVYYNLSGVPVDGIELVPGIYVKRTVYSDGTVESQKIVKR